MDNNNNILKAALEDQQREEAKNLGVSMLFGAYGRIFDDIVNVHATKEYLANTASKYGGIFRKIGKKGGGVNSIAGEQQKELGASLPKTWRNERFGRTNLVRVSDKSMSDRLIQDALVSDRNEDVGGIFHGGMTNVPEERTYLLDEGERVLSPEQNEDLTAFLRNVKNLNAQGIKHEQPLKIIGMRSERGFFDEVTVADERRARKQEREREEELKQTRNFRENVLLALNKTRSDIVSAFFKGMKTWWVKFKRAPVLTTMMSTMKGLWGVLWPMRKVFIDPIMGWLKRVRENLFGKVFRNETDRIVYSNEQITNVLQGKDNVSTKGSIQQGIRRLLTADIRFWSKNRRRSEVEQAQQIEDLIASGELTTSQLYSDRKFRKQRRIYEANADFITKRSVGSLNSALNDDRFDALRGKSTDALDATRIKSKFNSTGQKNANDLLILRKLYRTETKEVKLLTEIEKSTSTLVRIARMKQALGIVRSFGNLGEIFGGKGKGAIKKAGGGVLGRIGTAGSRAVGFLGNAGLVATAGLTGYSIGTLIEPYVRKIGDAVLKPFNTDFVDFVGGSIYRVVNTAETIYDKGRDYVSKLFTEEGRAQMKEAFVNGAIGLWAGVTEWFKTKVNELFEWINPRERIGRAFSAIKETGADIWNRAAKTTTSLIGEGRSVVTGWFGDNDIQERQNVVYAQNAFPNVSTRVAEKNVEIERYLKELVMNTKRTADKDMSVQINNPQQRSYGVLASDQNQLITGG